MQEGLFLKSGRGEKVIEKINQNRCMDCKMDLISTKRHPVYSSRLAVMGYICAGCREKRKTPAMKKREEEISQITKEVPKLENVNHNLLKSLKN
jgi:hypothetical protein